MYIKKSTEEARKLVLSIKHKTCARAIAENYSLEPPSLPLRCRERHVHRLRDPYQCMSGSTAREDGASAIAQPRIISQTTPRIQPSIAASPRSFGCKVGEKNCGSDPFRSALCSQAATA
jgi:hypothetical protein